MSSSSSSSSNTHLYDIPDVILSNIFTLIKSTRTRSSMSLVARKWLTLERATRTSLSLRGNLLRDLLLLKSSFRPVTHLDLSCLSPWGHSLLPDDSEHSMLIAKFLWQAFPSVESLILYSRTPTTLSLLAPLNPKLQHIKLIRWHQRCPDLPIGADLDPLLQNCHSLSSIDLSQFYCWTEDIPAALQSHPLATASLFRLNLLCPSYTEGFMSQQLLDITSVCPNLREFLAVCSFDPRYIDAVNEEALLGVAANCPRLTTLYLCDLAALATLRGDSYANGITAQDAKISTRTLEALFTALPLLEELALDVCHNVHATSPALETLSSKCPGLKRLRLGQFHGICRAVGRKLDGLATCSGLEELCVRNSSGLDDASLIAIAHGCPKLKKFHVVGCREITEMGMKTFTCVLRRTLVEVRISCCRNLEVGCAIKAMEPIRRTIQMLHVDCVWRSLAPESPIKDFDLNESDGDEDSDGELVPLPAKRVADCCEASTSSSKKCRYSKEEGYCPLDRSLVESKRELTYWERSWDQLKCLSLWIGVGDMLDYLHFLGIENCPVLEEIHIKVEGDSRRSGRPSDQAFGLTCLARYPQLYKMTLDCGDALGYALTAPTGQMDLSLWERFYLNGIGYLNLKELDYWPPQDRDVNHRSLCLPAVGLIAECSSLRKLFIHGTAHEHFMNFLLKIPNLRDCQLRAEYYPAPEDDMSTEMRVTSCSRFEDALNRRDIPD